MKQVMLTLEKLNSFIFSGVSQCFYQCVSSETKQFASQVFDLSNLDPFYYCFIDECPLYGIETMNFVLFQCNVKMKLDIVNFLILRSQNVFMASDLVELVDKEICKYYIKGGSGMIDQKLLIDFNKNK